MSINRGMDKDVVHINIYSGILLNHKTKQNNAMCSNMDGPRDCHTECYKSDILIERQIYDVIYMWNLKKKAQKNLFTKQNHRCRKLTYGYMGYEGEG